MHFIFPEEVKSAPRMKAVTVTLTGYLKQDPIPLSEYRFPGLKSAQEHHYEQPAKV